MDEGNVTDCLDSLMSVKSRVLFSLAATFSTCLFRETLLVSVTPSTCWLPQLLESDYGACSWSLWLSWTLEVCGSRNIYWH